MKCSTFYIAGVIPSIIIMEYALSQVHHSMLCQMKLRWPWDSHRPHRKGNEKTVNSEIYLSIEYLVLTIAPPPFTTKINFFILLFLLEKHHFSFWFCKSDHNPHKFIDISLLCHRLKPAARLDSSETGEAVSHSPAVSADQQAQQNQMQQHQQYLGDVTQGLPEFEELDLKDCPLPGNQCYISGARGTVHVKFKYMPIFK